MCHYPWTRRLGALGLELTGVEDTTFKAGWWGSFPADQDESEKLMCRRDSTGVKGCCDWFQPHQSPRLRFFSASEGLFWVYRMVLTLHWTNLRWQRCGWTWMLCALCDQICWSSYFGSRSHLIRMLKWFQDVIRYYKCLAITPWVLKNLRAPWIQPLILCQTRNELQLQKLSLLGASHMRCIGQEFPRFWWSYSYGP